MKKTKFNTLAMIALALAMLMCFFACAKVPAEGLWENATYRGDTTVGNGTKEIKADVVIGEDFITLTVKTDKATLGEALFENGLVNDASFFDTLNGIKADWNADKAYWSFYKGETYMMHGINDEKIGGGEHYRFVYTK